VENLQGEDALKTQKEALIKAGKEHSGLEKVAVKISESGNLDTISLTKDLLETGDASFIKLVVETQDEFVNQIMLKSKIVGFKWDDFILRFEWIVVEKVAILKMISELDSAVEEGLKAFLTSHEGKFNRQTVETFIDQRQTVERVDDDGLEEFNLLV
jgi:hypothetical protein